MRLIPQSFENPVTEDLTWETDIFVSDNGTEQRRALLDMPRRDLQVTYNFTTESDARALARAMFAGSNGFNIPAYHQAAKIAPVALGVSALTFDPLRTELRNGDPAIVFNSRSGLYELTTVAIVGATGCTLDAPLTKAWGALSSIAPLWAMYNADSSSLSAGNTNDNVSSTQTFTQLDFIDPFLNPLNTSVLEMFNGLPVHNWQAVGSAFDIAYNNGATLNDYGQAVTIRNMWKHSQEQFARDFLCPRILNRADWQTWQAFLNYCNGSQNPFYMPTYRPDFALVGAIVGGSMTLQGLDYLNDYFPFAAFAQFAIFTKAGRFNTSITSVSAIGGNTLCTLNPPLPDGADYATNQRASLLLKCRIADDKASFVHDSLQTVVTLNIRTVDA